MIVLAEDGIALVGDDRSATPSPVVLPTPTAAAGSSR